MKRTAPIIVATLAVLLLLFAAYMGSYYALLKGRINRSSYDPNYGGRRKRLIVVYRVEGDWLERTLWPANQIDRLVRPNVWPKPIKPSPTPLVNQP